MQLQPIDIWDIVRLVGLCWNIPVAVTLCVVTWPMSKSAGIYFLLYSLVTILQFGALAFTGVRLHAAPLQEIYSLLVLLMPLVGYSIVRDLMRWRKRQINLWKGAQEES